MSPVQVGSGRPGSRPQLVLERGRAVAGCHEPLRRERARGPQHQVKAAASSDVQRERRAAHFTAKATSAALVVRMRSGSPRGMGSGTWVGPDEGQERPVCAADVRQGRSYKPTAKSSGAQRGSEGVVVLLMGVQHNAPGGKGPYFGRACGGGTRKGMVRTTGPNDPDEPRLIVNARCLPNRLCPAAERRPVGRGLATDPRGGDALRWARAGCSLGPCMPRAKTIGKPDAGKSHVRFERGSVETGRIAIPRH